MTLATEKLNRQRGIKFYLSAIFILAFLFTLLLLFSGEGSSSGSNFGNSNSKNDLAVTDFGDFVLTSSQLSDGSISRAKILNGSVTLDKLAKDTIIQYPDGKTGPVNVSNKSILEWHLADGSVSTAKILDSAITTAKLADGSITEIKIIDGAISSGKIRDGSILAIDLSNGSIITAKIADGAITESKIASNSISTDKLQNGSVTLDKLAPGVLDGITINNDSLNGDVLIDNSVNGSKIEDNSITGDKIENNSVTGDDIQDNSITGDDIQDNSVTNLDLADGSVTGVKLADNSINGAKLTNLSITAAKIALGTIAGAQVASDGSVVKSIIGGGGIQVTNNNNGSYSLKLITTCSDGQVLSWNSAGTDWVCTTPPGGAGLSDTDDLAEGTLNLYYTTTRFNTDFNSKDTDELTEGTTNLYYTEARFDSSLGGKTLDDITEGTTNKFYTETAFDNSFSNKDSDDLTEGASNLFWTQSRFDIAFGLKDTDDLAEGATNLYYTETRFDNSFAGKSLDDLAEGVTNKFYTETAFDNSLSGKTTTDVAEGTNLYYTEERAQDGVGTALTDTTEINFTYNDAGNAITADLIDGSIAESRLDVLNAPTDTYSLTWNQGSGKMEWVNVSGGGATTFNSLSDTNLTAVAQGDVLYYDGTDWVNLAAGTSGQFLQTAGVGANPTWANISGSLASGTLSGNTLEWNGVAWVESSALTNDGTDVATSGQFSSNGNTIIGSDAADTLLINAILQGSNPLVFEGATTNAFTTTLAITDPTANNTITLPDSSGTLVLTSDLTGLAATTDFDTETELEGLLTDVTNIYTNNDGNLNDDDLSDNDTGDLAEGTNLYFTNERVDDQVALLVQNGTGISWAYDDGANTFTPTISLSAFDTDNLAEGATNFYWSDTRFDNALALKDTDDLAEGLTNLYYTETRFDNSFAGKSLDDLAEGVTNKFYTETAFDNSLSGKTLDDITEGITNLYFTNERVDDQVALLIKDGLGINWTYDDRLGTLTGVVDFTDFDTDNLAGKILDDITEGITNKFYTETAFDNSLSGKTTTDVAEGTNLYFTDERAQDGVGTALTDTTEINFTYNDAGNAITADLIDGTIAETRLAVLNGPADGQILSWNQGSAQMEWINNSGGSSTFSALSDTNLTAVAQGDVLYYDGTDWVNLAAGTSGQFLQTQGTGANPIWATSPGALANGTLANNTLRWNGSAWVESSALTNNGTDITVSGQLNANGNTIIGDANTDTVTFNSILQGAIPLVFEGSTSNTFETSLSVTDPTADRTITLPDADGTVALTSDLTGLAATTDFDTEAELEGLLTDVTNVYTNNDGNLNDDDLSNNSTSDLAEGTNLYFTDERVDDRVSVVVQNGTGISWSYNDGANTFTPTISLAAFSTDNLAEGATNLYYTGARFNSDLATKTTTDLTEGTNQYFTDERVDDRVATLVQNGTGITWSYNDGANIFTPTITLGTSIDSSEIVDGTIVNADVNAAAGIVESKLALNFPTHTNANDPTAAQKAKLVELVDAADTNIAIGNKNISNIHTQNTDTGTTATSFQINSGASGPRLKNSTGTLQVRNAADSGFANLQAADIQGGNLNLTGNVDFDGVLLAGSTGVQLTNAVGKIQAISSTYFADLSGANLTGLNATQLLSGTVPSARLSGSYTGITGLGTVTTGVWNGTRVDISDYTNLAAGTNLTLVNDTLNVNDAFLTNTGNDSTTGILTAAGFVSTPTGSAPISPTAGQVYYNSLDSNMYVYDGTQWVDLTVQSAGGGGAASMVHYAEADAQQTNATLTMTPALSTTFTPTTTGNYLIEYTYEISNSSSSKLSLSNVDYCTGTVACPGGGTIIANHTQSAFGSVSYSMVSGFKRVSLTGAQPYNVDVSHRTEVTAGGATSYIQNVRVIVWKL
ncbi:MAG: hypothetical protein Q9M91_00930 [Candidatus Dojkabacteria bacterium]|nr:hypothetical protein [Candidatus Dojkabacteria bacterium]MDQ7020390.1 hypothetical protein [Candidatus Dojkabacteria bacterium]